MSHEAERELLSERLKRLRDAEFAGGMADFDLEAAIRGGRRRRFRRTVAEVGGALAGVAVVVVVVVGGIRPGPEQGAVTAVATSPATPTSVPPRPQPQPAGPSRYLYTKVADTVTVYDGAPADGNVVAKVTASEIVRDPSGAGSARLRVEAVQDFTFSTDDFVWSGEGVDRPVVKPTEVTVRAGQSRSVRLRFADVRGSALIWEPLTARTGPHARGQYTWYR